MNNSTTIVANDGHDKVKVVVRTKSRPNLTRAESHRAHHLRVDRVTQAIAHEFHYRDIKVK